jgi:hypothetical protein
MIRNWYLFIAPTMNDDAPGGAPQQRINDGKIPKNILPRRALKKPISG